MELWNKRYLPIKNSHTTGAKILPCLLFRGGKCAPPHLLDPAAESWMQSFVWNQAGWRQDRCIQCYYYNRNR